jgi:hypothetical protein
MLRWKLPLLLKSDGSAVALQNAQCAFFHATWGYLPSSLQFLPLSPFPAIQTNVPFWQPVCAYPCGGKFYEHARGPSGNSRARTAPSPRLLHLLRMPSHVPREKRRPALSRTLRLLLRSPALSARARDQHPRKTAAATHPDKLTRSYLVNGSSGGRGFSPDAKGLGSVGFSP